MIGVLCVLWAIQGACGALDATAMPSNDGAILGQFGNLEQNIAAVFSKVAYGSTTTKRSIPDSVAVLSLTTVPSPLLTTFRYRERERESHDIDDQVINHSAYDLELEKDHALPTSAPNADILKSNNNPTYPNPNRHHNQDRHRLQSLPNSTENAKKGPTMPMFPGDMPSYAPPARSFFTPPLPPEYQNPFADKPTLRGTNSDLGVIHTSNGFHRRPIPPPSLVPGYERIPYRPPDLVPARPEEGDISSAKDETHIYEIVRKKALNTPSIKTQDGAYANVTETGTPGTSAPSVAAGVLHFPSISRILSGSNGRKEDIPDILLRTVTVRPSPKSPTVTAVTHYQGMNLNKNRDEEISTEADTVLQSKITETTTIFETDDDTFSTHRIQKLVNSDSPSTVEPSQAPPVLSADRQSALVTWTIAWNIHVYMSAILYTILAVYSIFKMILYDKLTHLFSQTYFIAIHMVLIAICLGRIFYLCYDAYNMHSSFTVFVSELLLNLPALMLAITFATLILFLLLRSLNHKANRYSALLRPLTIAVGGGVHIGLCITLHYVESYGLRSTKMAYDRPQPRVLSLICQIIYIFVCLSLGTFYLYIYRVLKRVLHTKSQNYIHGYQNLSYAIHITIATALLFVLMAALQVYGAVSISSAQDLDWLQWGYQFSLRLIEIAIVSLISWVACLKTGAAKVAREKATEQHISGFALFPCTSSSSQEHFETDYPAVCNANTNLHTYTLRTGKAIYDDNFTVNPVEDKVEDASPPKTESLHSSDVVDHYENPNFELQSRKEEMFDVCYTEPMAYDFQTLERPTMERPTSRNEFRASKNLKVLKGARHYNPYNSFERRPPDEGGVRKSGTLGNIGHYHRRGTMQQQRPRYPGRFLRTDGAPDKSTSANSSDDSVNSGSMLVAEHGFVRFRALDDMDVKDIRQS
ncbi:uncharacterized protein LOC132257083 [Phlebotomus argentipes]|uniref:uncharacterized protein LOC132257083 n=1 Tax=Phlebotomus argentipes TaxID=94469 RepID=UPI002892C1C1|nr:uncharacterized protein LOC132257083 [Phlebotomus argentipes]